MTLPDFSRFALVCVAFEQSRRRGVADCADQARAREQIDSGLCYCGARRDGTSLRYSKSFLTSTFLDPSAFRSLRSKPVRSAELLASCRDRIRISFVPKSPRWQRRAEGIERRPRRCIRKF